MKIGIMVPSIGAFGQKGFYNIQEVGHAKALSKRCNAVEVYRLVDEQQEYTEETIEGCENAKLYLLPSKRLGSNGFPDMARINPELDALLLCADTQLAVPHIASWTKKRGIKLILYIGVTESHSNSKLIKNAMDLLCRRNYAVYRKYPCAVKTPSVKAKLENLGITDVTVAPVGLDLSVVVSDPFQSDAMELKTKYGYTEMDKVLLFIGRMTEEKQPLHMIDLFDRLCRQDNNYKLIMIGTGELREAVAAEVEKRGLATAVRMIDRIPNKDIWELYRIADCFVNLNQQEIFGMAILEAMYYGCKVVAWKAPGPSFIIEDGISGCLADSDAGIMEAIAEKVIVPEAAHKRIIDHFTWDRTAEKILTLAERE